MYPAMLESRQSSRLCSAILVALFASPASVGSAPSAPVQQIPVIRHDPVEYLPNNRFPKIDATIDSGVPLRSVKLYFRSANYPDFYYVDMAETLDEDSDVLRMSAVIPIPDEETSSVVYFIEVVDASFQTYRSPIYDAATTSEPVLTVFQGDDPQILLGKVSESLPDVPPGFKAIGIAGFIGVGTLAALGGTGAGAGGAIGAGTAVLAGSAAAAGAAAGVAVLTQETVKACFTAEPSSLSLEEGESIRLDARCSEPSSGIERYEWDLGDGRSRSEPLINPIFPAPGSPPLAEATTYTIRLTVVKGSSSDTISQVLRVTPRGGPPPPGTSTTSSTTTSTTTTTAPPAPPEACIETTPSPPEVMVNEPLVADGRCSTPREAITSFEWDLGDGRTRSGPRITPFWSVPGTYPLSLTVSDDLGREDSAEREVVVRPAPPPTTTTTAPAADIGIASITTSPAVPVNSSLFDVIVVIDNLGPDPRPPFTEFTMEVFSSGFALVTPFTGSVTANLGGSCGITPLDQTNFKEFICDFFSTTVPVGSGVITMTISGLETIAADSLSLTARLDQPPSPTPDPNPSNNFLQVPVTVTLKTLDPGQRALDVDLTGHLDVPPNDGNLAASAIVNGARTYSARNAGPYRQRWQARAGKNRVEARLDGLPGAEGRWRFDFAGDQHFVPGSLEVEQGEILASDPGAVVFRVRRNEAQRVVFTFDLRP